MNGMQQGQANMHSWHAMYAVADRQKVVQILSSSLKEIQGANFDMQKATTMAQEFEKFTFMKSQSRDEYLRLIKQKIAQLRGSMRAAAGTSEGMMGQQMGGSMGAQHGGIGGQSMGYMQQQQQQSQGGPNAAQMQPQMRNGSMSGPQSQPHPGQQNMTPNGQQIQQISNLIRNAPIPQALLSKIPNLPSNVNTWSQIFDCFQKKIIPATAMPLVKEIHNAHIQLAIRQHQQQKLNQAQGQRMASGQPPQHQQPNMGNMNPVAGMGVSNNTNQMVNNMGNFGMNNLTPQQKQQLLQRQMQQRNSHSGQTPQILQQASNIAQPQHTPQAPTQSQPPQSLDTPNFQITAQDIMKYSTDALNLLTRLQNNGSIQQNLDQSQKESFIKKYIIHEKTQLWKQKNGAANGSSVSGGNANPIMAQVQRLSQQGQMAMQQGAQRQQPMQKMPQSSPMMSNMNMGHQQPVMKTQQQMNNSTSPLMNQRYPANPMGNNNPTHAGMGATGMNTNIPGNNMINQQRGSFGGNQQNMHSVLPPMTDDIKLKLRQLVEQVSGNNVALKDVTMLLSPQDKNTVRETMMKISQQYANVDSIISYFFLITRNVEGTKRLIQMKYMTKNIIENLQRGIFLAAPDLLEKLRSQYQKYFDYVKEQFTIRRQQHQAQHNQGAQVSNNQQINHPAPSQIPQQTQQRMPPVQQQHPMNIGPANSWPNVGMPPQQWKNMNSSPLMSNGSPVMPNSVPPQPQMQQKPPSRSSVSQSKKTPTGSSSGGGTAGRRKGSTTKNAIANTNAANIATPASLNAIKTPNSIPTPHAPGPQSNKNTPSSQSPSQVNKSAPKSNTPDMSEIFIQNKADAKLAKRRELSKSDPEKFFFSSLANLLELDDSIVETTGLLSDTQNPLLLTKSPLSPELGSGEWTCEIKPLAITTAFQQVDVIKDYVADNIIDSCVELSSIKSETDSKGSSKRSNDQMENDFDIDNLFEDKKIKLDSSDAKLLYEPVDFDAWKEFVVSSIHSKV